MRSAFVLVWLLVPTLLAQQPTTAIAAADAWPQFRGSPRLTGNSASTPPATLKLLWTYDAGEVVD